LKTVRLLWSCPPAWCFSALASVSLSVATVLSAAQSPSAESISLDDGLHQLADRVVAIPNFHGPVRLEFFHDANFENDSAKEWQDSLRQDLESRRVSLTDDSAATLLRIGVAETPTQLVLSAATRVADKDEVRLVTFPRATFRVASLPVAPVRLEKQLVYQSSDRILDVSSLGNGGSSGMVILTYRNGGLDVLRVDASGAVQQSAPLTAAGPLLSRDPRAEISVQSDANSVILPAKSCKFTWAAPADTECHLAKVVWRESTVLTPSCGAGGWKLLADGSDWTTGDLLQVVPDSSTQKGSAAVGSDFPGPILSINGDQNPSSALVVARNLRTGNYEVYKITLVCGN
jgi:hypothetical protein